MAKQEGWSIVTGASSGIGLVFARELAARGRNVLAVARRLDRLNELAHEHNGRIVPLAADLATSDGLQSVAARIAQLDTIDLVINNAGVATGGDFSESILEKEIAEIDLNVKALVTLT